MNNLSPTQAELLTAAIGQHVSVVVGRGRFRSTISGTLTFEGSTYSVTVIDGDDSACVIFEAGDARSVRHASHDRFFIDL